VGRKRATRGTGRGAPAGRMCRVLDLYGSGDEVQHDLLAEVGLGRFILRLDRDVGRDRSPYRFASFVLCPPGELREHRKDSDECGSRRPIASRPVPVSHPPPVSDVPAALFRGRVRDQPVNGPQSACVSSGRLGNGPSGVTPIVASATRSRRSSPARLAGHGVRPGHGVRRNSAAAACLGLNAVSEWPAGRAARRGHPLGHQARRTRLPVGARRHLRAAQTRRWAKVLHYGATG
jgi:hypothetical protein